MGSEMCIRDSSDSDYAGDTVERKSTSGYIFVVAGGAISWKSKKQAVVATSSCEAEYLAAVQLPKNPYGYHAC